MNHLNNQQVILLAILVSFVTSIATGIFTVTLLEQAPGSVTQTINRVVERTVETVTPAQSRETVVRERVIVDKGSELVSQAVERTSPSIVAIFGDVPVLTGNGEEEEVKTVTKQVATGFFISEDGVVLSWSHVDNATNYHMRPGGSFGTSTVPLTAVKQDEEKNLLLFQPEFPGEDEDIAAVFPALLFLEEDVSVGQTAIVVSTDTVAVSFVSGLVKDDDGGKFYRLYLEGDGSLTGSPVVDVEERVIGILATQSRLITAGVLREFVSAESSSQSTEPGAGSGKTSQRGSDNQNIDEST